MKLLLLIILCFLLITCGRSICHINVDEDSFIKAIGAGEDCEKMASCGSDGGVDEGLLNMCLAEKERLKKKDK